MFRKDKLISAIALSGGTFLLASTLLFAVPESSSAAADCNKRVSDANAALEKKKIDDKALRADLTKAEALCKDGKAKEADQILAQIEKKIGEPAKN